MDLKTFSKRSNSILETFQEVREELSALIDLDSGRDRQKRLWETEEKLFDNVFLKQVELSNELFYENKELNKELNKKKGGAYE